MKKYSLPLCLFAIFILTACSATPTATPAAPMPTAVPSTQAPTQAPTDTAQPEVGSIAGQLSYPAEMIPALRVVAFRTDNGSYYFVDTPAGQNTFTLANLPPGTYHVVAYAIATPTIAGGYTQAVLCGLKVGCTDQSLIDVIVTVNQAVTNINPGDWYAPEGTYPPMPQP